jgi:membrane-associated phospholipid phosphatase
MKANRPIAWLALLITSLVLFLAWMPAAMRTVIWNGLIARGWPSTMLLVFSLVALSLVWSAGQRVDVWAFLIFNLHKSRPLWLDRMMLGFTQLGSGAIAVVIGLVLFLAGDRLAAYELILGTITLWMVVELVKALVRRPRPLFLLTEARAVGSPSIGHSFPSGHTSQAFFTVTLMARHFHVTPWIAVLLYVIALLIGITRMYVGAHYPRDVLAGAILGSAWGLLGTLIDEYILG